MNCRYYITLEGALVDEFVFHAGQDPESVYYYQSGSVSFRFAEDRISGPTLNMPFGEGVLSVYIGDDKVRFNADISMGIFETNRERELISELPPAVRGLGEYQQRLLAWEGEF